MDRKKGRWERTKFHIFMESTIVILVMGVCALVAIPELLKMNIDVTDFALYMGSALIFILILAILLKKYFS